MDTNPSNRRLSLRELLFVVTYVAVAVGLLRIAFNRHDVFMIAPLFAGLSMIVVGFYVAVVFLCRGRNSVRRLHILLLVLLCALFIYALSNVGVQPVRRLTPEERKQLEKQWEDLQRREREDSAAEQSDEEATAK